MECSESSPLQMSLQSGDGALTIRVLAAAGEGPTGRDLDLRVDAQAGGYFAKGVHGYLGGPDVQGFVNELEALVQTCRGSASIAAFSPKHLALKARNVDLLGHFALEFELGSQVYEIDRVFECGIRGGFGISLSQLETLLHWFRASCELERFGDSQA